MGCCQGLEGSIYTCSFRNAKDRASRFESIVAWFRPSPRKLQGRPRPTRESGLQPLQRLLQVCPCGSPVDHARYRWSFVAALDYVTHRCTSRKAFGFSLADCFAFVQYYSRLVAEGKSARAMPLVSSASFLSCNNGMSAIDLKNELDDWYQPAHLLCGVFMPKSVSRWIGSSARRCSALFIHERPNIRTDVCVCVCAPINTKPS